MISLSTIKNTLVLTLCIILVSSCSEQEFSQAKIGSHLPESVLEKVHELDLNPKDFQYLEVPNVNGESSKVVLEIGVDSGMDIDEFLKLSTKKQYRTDFLVDTDTYHEIDIIALTGNAPFGLTAQSQRGLTDAVKNWNKVKRNGINLNLDFTSTPNFDPNFYEINVSAVPDLGFSGFAEFPSSAGKPGSFVVVDSDMVNLGSWSRDAIEHIFTHELGHTIGFRHTDWQTRRSCVEAGVSPQEESEAFAELLPWTVPNIPGILYQDNSIMNACFNINTTNGELNRFDQLGLQNMYFDPFDF